MPKINIQSKLIIIIIAILFVISTSKGNYFVLVAHLIACIGIIIFFKPNLIQFLKRTSVIFIFPLSISIFIPFFNKGKILHEFNFYFFNLTVTDNGLTTFFTTIFKSFISVILIAALVTSSKDLEILHGLRKIFLPKIIVSIIFLMYRYFFLIQDEARVGQLSINSRIFKKSFYSVNKKLTYLAGTLFIKSIDRAENIYKSMESRGFDGDFEFVDFEKKPEISNIYIIDNEKKDRKNLLNIVFLVFFLLTFTAIKSLEFIYF